MIFTPDFSGGRLLSAPYVCLSVRLPVTPRMLSLYQYLVHALAISWFWSLIKIMVGLRQISHFLWDFCDKFCLKADRRTPTQRMDECHRCMHDISVYKWWQNDEQKRSLLFITLSHLANCVGVTGRSQTSWQPFCFTKCNCLRFWHLKLSLCFALYYHNTCCLLRKKSSGGKGSGNITTTVSLFHKQMFQIQGKCRVYCLIWNSLEHMRCHDVTN